MRSSPREVTETKTLFRRTLGSERYYKTLDPPPTVWRYRERKTFGRLNRGVHVIVPSIKQERPRHGFWGTWYRPYRCLVTRPKVTLPRVLLEPVTPVTLVRSRQRTLVRRGGSGDPNYYPPRRSF